MMIYKFWLPLIQTKYLIVLKQSTYLHHFHLNLEKVKFNFKNVVIFLSQFF